MLAAPFVATLLLLLHSLCALPSLAQTPPTPDDLPAVAAPREVLVLRLRLNSEPPTLSRVVVAGVKLFFSRHVSLPPSDIFFTALEEGPPPIVEFSIVADAASIPELSASLRDYVSSRGLDDAFASQGLRGTSFALADDASQPSVAGDAVPPGDTDSVDTVPVAAVTASPQPSLPPRPSPRPLVLTPLSVDAVPDPAPPLNLSEPLLLLINSPVLAFPNELKELIRRLLPGGAQSTTSASAPRWHLLWASQAYPPPAPEQPLYLASFVTLGDNASLPGTVQRAASSVRDGSLTRQLRARGATDVSVDAVAPPLPPVASPDAPSAEAASNSSGVAPPAVFVQVPLNVSAPLSGFPGKVLTLLKDGAAAATRTAVESWVLTGARRDDGSGAGGTTAPSGARHRRETGPAAIAVELRVAVVNASAVVPLVRDVANYVRSRRLDAELVNAGWLDVRVRLRPRLTTFEDEIRGGGAPAISANASTVAASVVGVLIVLLVAFGILTLVPRRAMFGASRSEARASARLSRTWWGGG